MDLKEIHKNVNAAHGYSLTQMRNLLDAVEKAQTILEYYGNPENYGWQGPQTAPYHEAINVMKDGGERATTFLNWLEDKK